MIRVYPYHQLGQSQTDWLTARHHFSFGNYYQRDRLKFGVLRVINDDIIKPGFGFDLHPHKDMEIITYIRKGALTHRDNFGNEGRIQAGNIQIMSAGTGIYHSEYNLEDEETHLYQIWITPHTKGIAPHWQSRDFPVELKTDHLSLLASGRAEDRGPDVLPLNQNAALYAARFAKNSRFFHPVKDQAYLLVSEGDAEINGHLLHKGDGCEITETDKIEINTQSEAEIVAFDIPK